MHSELHRQLSRDLHDERLAAAARERVARLASRRRQPRRRRALGLLAGLDVLLRARRQAARSGARG
jgi:hypothetical protein